MNLALLVAALTLGAGKPGEVEQLVEMARTEACKVKTSHVCAAVEAFAAGTAPKLDKPLLSIGLSEIASDGSKTAYTVLSVQPAAGAEPATVGEFVIAPDNEKEAKQLAEFIVTFANGKADPKSEISQLMDSGAKSQPRLKLAVEGNTAVFKHNRPLGGRWLRQNGKKLYVLALGGGLERPAIVVTELPDRR